MGRPITVKQALAFDRWMFVVDEDGALWSANVFACVEGYGQQLEWHQIKLPEVA
jgi:hypothetical protein